MCLCVSLQGAPLTSDSAVHVTFEHTPQQHSALPLIHLRACGSNKGAALQCCFGISRNTCDSEVPQSASIAGHAASFCSDRGG